MDNNTKYKNWKIETDNENILWLYLDKDNSHVNTLDMATLDELEIILDSIQTDYQTLKGIVFASAKESGFIHGANIEQFTRIKTAEEAKYLISRGQIVFDKIERLPVPTVAMIEGFCLGGGLELVLACTYRVALDETKKTLGLPEVLLGIHPGWGGSVRLPRLIGATTAMDLILSGRKVTAKSAEKMGFIDAAVPKRQLKRAVVYYLHERPAAHKASWLQAASNLKPSRLLLAKLLQRKVSEKANPDHYPAPYAMIENWQRYGLDHQTALQGELNSVATLATSDTAKNLIRVFFLQEHLKGLAKQASFQPQRIHVIGAGVMGGDIAAWCALRGFKVTLEDQNHHAIAATLQRAYTLYSKQLKYPRLVQEAMDRLIPDNDGVGISKADVIIEAIFENLEVKQNLFKNIESRIHKDAILATNTSSIPLDEINSVLKHPERLVGIHFFNPVAKMQLIEVVHGKLTSQKVLNQAMAFVKAIGRLPVPVASKPGFLVNRALMPYLMESMELLQEGVPAAVIDKVAEDFGMPMGPIELADTVGLDVCLSVAENLGKHYSLTVPEQLRKMVAEKKLGKKTGEGFYNYKHGSAQKLVPSREYHAAADLQDRLIMRMLNECMACLREEVVTEGDLLDAAMIFGTGFAPFRGGPMHYISTQGVNVIRDRLLQLSKTYGARFIPDQGFSEVVHHEKMNETA